LGGRSFTSITAGNSHTCGIATGGAAYCWGYNAAWQLSSASSASYVASPVAVSGGLTFTALSSGGDHSCGVAGGAAYCWGRNNYGELGNGGYSSNAGVPATVLGNLTFTAISVGPYHACGLVTSGRAYCWGRGNWGQIGDGGVQTTDRLAPVAVAGGQSYVSIHAATNHTCALLASGAVDCWGLNSDGQLGTNTIGVAQPAPVRVSGNLAFAQLAVGEDFTCARTNADRVYCWGYNPDGQFGLGPNRSGSYSTPVASAGTLQFLLLAAGRGHMCGVTLRGAASCTGDNAHGQIGDSTTVQRFSLTRVAGNITFR
jgi:alpha-tubulin suppressor-like RCC1 family protein